MNIAACGLDCDACHFKERCPGCSAISGKPFWAAGAGMECCPMYGCAQGKGYSGCGPCAEKPCALWHTTREPGIPDAEWDTQIKQRLKNLT